MFASLSKTTTEEALRLMATLGSHPSIPASQLDQAGSFLALQYPQPPRLLDMFGGGGTIAFEAACLGAETYSMDANELSVFLQQCNLVYSKEIADKNISAIVSESGQRILHRLMKDTSPLFPLRQYGLSELPTKENTFGYLWTYSTQCSACGYRYYLSKRPWLSKKKGRSTALRVCDREQSQEYEIKEVERTYRHPSVWRSSAVQCPSCDYAESGISVKKCRDELVAMIRLRNGNGKEFVPTVSGSLPDYQTISQIEASLLEELGTKLPSSRLPRWSGIVNPALYGIDTHSDFLNPRQRVVLLMLIKGLRDEYQFLQTMHSPETARYVVSILSGLIDQLVDWNCRLSMWISQNEQVGRAFCGPGVSMLWDYVETDPLLSGPANLWDKLGRIEKAVGVLESPATPVRVLQGFAQDLPFDDCYFDAIVTDPPYYDNIFYGVLADFFYAWKRLALSVVEPDLFRNPSTNVDRELVASTKRNGANAHEKYCKELEKAISEAARVLRPDGAFSFVYSHSSLQGWEALVRAYRKAPLQITSVQPLSIERKQRPRAMSSVAVNTCLVFVAHKCSEEKPSREIGDLKKRLQKISMGEFVDGLEESGWHEQDIAIATFAQGVAMTANSRGVNGCGDDFEVLRALEEVVKMRFPAFAVKKRRSL